MLRDVYPPFLRLPIESNEDQGKFQQSVEDMNVSDDDLVKYMESYFTSYRKTVEEFFSQIADSLWLYACAPFHTTVVRIGKNGVIVGHRRSNENKIEVKQVEDFDPPLDSFNVLEIVKRLRLENCWFDFTPCQYSAEEAHARALRDALKSVLEFFWRSIPNGEVFEKICLKLIEAEGIHVDGVGETAGGKEIDASAKVVLQEPAGFRRIEAWRFEFKHYPNNRLSAAQLREAEQVFSAQSSAHVLCIVTSDDLTSVSLSIASESPQIRVWDRSVLDLLVNRHLDVLRTCFDAYPKAVEELSRRLEANQGQNTAIHTKEFTEKLARCPTGKKHFAAFEHIGIDVLRFLFPKHLGEPNPQSPTLDRKQRRDVLFRNNRTSAFFDRLFLKFSADSLIVDFKNHDDHIEAGVVFDVSKYANKALGYFVLVVSRKGPADSARAAQLRVYRDSNTIVLVVSDADLLEMIHRKERGHDPEDVLSDKLDELLRQY